MLGWGQSLPRFKALYTPTQISAVKFRGEERMSIKTIFKFIRGPPELGRDRSEPSTAHLHYKAEILVSTGVKTEECGILIAENKIHV